MMKRNQNPLLCLAITLLALGCRDQPRPVENAPATAAPPAGLTPLTSRDGGSTSATAEPAAGAQLPPGHPSIAGGAAAPAAAETGTISGTVDVAPSRKGDIKGGALFVIARNASTHQVVAAQREASMTFPVSFTVSAADVMMQGVAFEGPLDVTARWSKSGDAMPGSGDIEGTVRGVAIGTKGVKLVLSEVRP
jgi:hypothetical protein